MRTRETLQREARELAALYRVMSHQVTARDAAAAAWSLGRALTALEKTADPDVAQAAIAETAAIAALDATRSLMALLGSEMVV